MKCKKCGLPVYAGAVYHADCADAMLEQRQKCGRIWGVGSVCGKVWLRVGGETHSMTADRLREIFRAEHDGRLIILKED